MAEALDAGRESFRRRAWADTYTQLSAADRVSQLAAEDLELLVTVAYLVGRDSDGAELSARAYRELVSRGDAPKAARSAFWLAFHLLNRGDIGQAGGWLARARRLLDPRHDCVEQGYLRFPAAVQKYVEGAYASAYALASETAEIGERFRDVDLVTLARHVQGRALIRQGATAEGMALLDEAMVAVTGGEVSAIVAGDTYCGVIDACAEVFDLRRVQEWTASLSHWVDGQPDLVLYRGQCLVHRAEIMQLHGAWPDAMEEALRARDRLSQPPDQPAVGAAFYQQGELHRLTGEFARAEEAYRQASRRGRQPQPGLAQLRLAQGQTDAAQAAMRHALDGTGDRLSRSKTLPAYIEIMLAVNDIPAARLAADELSQTATDVGAPFLRAVAGHALGAVRLAEGDATAALAELGHSWTVWQQLDAPYEAARVRVHIGLACRQLGDTDGAAMALDAARWVFQQLGAGPDLARVEALSTTAAVAVGGPLTGAAGRLTAREVQVLRLVAVGKTNRAIAADLFLSEKTVASHVSHIFTKLELRSRSAATAYAYEHHLM